MRTVHVETGKPYDIFIERGIIDKCGEYIGKLSFSDSQYHLRIRELGARANGAG